MRTTIDQLAKSQFIYTLPFTYNDTEHSIPVFHNLENQDSYLSQELPELFQYNIDLLSPEVKENYTPVLYNLIEDSDSITHIIILKLVSDKLPEHINKADLLENIQYAFWDEDSYPNPTKVIPNYPNYDIITVQVIGYF